MEKLRTIVLSVIVPFVVAILLGVCVMKLAVWANS
jgi:hypothetical protein